MPLTKRDKMGEVIVRVRLSNGMDVEMAEAGLLERDKVRTCEVSAVVDTGSTKSIIAVNVAQQLGLTILRQSFAQLADGSHVPVNVSGSIQFEVEGRETLEDAYVLGDEVLIGQTVLESTDLLVDCKNQRLIGKHPGGRLHRL